MTGAKASRMWQARKLAAGKCCKCGRRRIAPPSKRFCAVCAEVVRRVARAKGGHKARRKAKK